MIYDYSSVSNEYLIEKAKDGCQHSKDLVFERNIPLVKKLAVRWNRKGSSDKMDDLIGTGYLALTIAYETFNPELGFKFTSYLGKVVWGEYCKIARSKTMKCRSIYSTISLDSHMADDEDCNTYHEVAYDEYENEKYIDIDNKLYKDLFIEVTNKDYFNEKERVVAREFFLNNLTLSEISRKIGVSRQAVHQAYNRGLKKLRNEKRLFA